MIPVKNRIFAMMNPNIPKSFKLSTSGSFRLKKSADVMIVLLLRLKSKARKEHLTIEFWRVTARNFSRMFLPYLFGEWLNIFVFVTASVPLGSWRGLLSKRLFFDWAIRKGFIENGVFRSKRKCSQFFLVHQVKIVLRQTTTFTAEA